ncbi:MAG TPA: orotidine-5'-phosphate decarboxylase [Clostridiales bacterium]|nr:orotidine-5'-phosphate decarboxylase [Clostridiales bacterium]
MSVNTLVQKIREKNNPTVAGLDARLEYIPSRITDRYIGEYGQTLRAAAASMLEFNKGLIDALCDIVPAIKPQAAYYELLGPDGAAVLRDTIAYAHEKGMYVIADIKRNDIGATATAYAQAYLGRSEVCGASLPVYDSDSCTVNAYLGTDGIHPFLEECKNREKSIYILVKTSNKSSGEFQNRLMGDQPLYVRMAEKVAEWGEDLMTECGYSQVGAVVGATYPEEQRIIRQIIPHSYFLVPGYGAQGAAAKDIANAFNDDGLGAIVNSSRGIMCAWKKCDLDYQEAARREAIRMRDDIVGAIR